MALARLAPLARTAAYLVQYWGVWWASKALVSGLVAPRCLAGAAPPVAHLAQSQAADQRVAVALWGPAGSALLAAYLA